MDVFVRFFTFMSGSFFPAAPKASWHLFWLDESGLRCRCVEHFEGQGRAWAIFHPLLGTLSGNCSGLVNLGFGGQAEPQVAEDEDQNDAWKPAFVNEKVVEAQALPPIVCIKCGGHSIVGEPASHGNPSILGMERLRRIADRETTRSGQECLLSVEDAPQSGMVAAAR